MKAYLIDPFQQTVTNVELAGAENPRKHLRDIYALLNCELIDAVTISEQGDAVLVDDEGLLKDMNSQRFFQLGNELDGCMLLAGRAIVVGTNSYGNSVNPAFTIDELRTKVTWPEHAAAVHQAEQQIGFTVIFGENGGNDEQRSVG
jgi:hypothetical protein